MSEQDRVNIDIITNKNIKMKCDVGLMIDHDVAEKKIENKIGMSTY